MSNTANNILTRSIRNIKSTDTKIVPCETYVVLEFYEDNPYRGVEVTDSGLVLGVDGTKRYKSNESGEMEDSEEYIACAKVIAVGPSCRNVQVGEDVYAVKHLANPLPYKKLGYRVLSESNIICRIIKND